MIALSIASDRGVIDLPGDATHGFVFQPGPKGLGAPTDVFEWQESPVQGARVRSHRVALREAQWPILILGDDTDDVRALHRQLASMTAPDANPVMLARYDTGEVFRLPFVVVGGLEDGVEYEGATDIEVKLLVRCPNPFWVSETPETVGPINASSVDVGLLPDLAELHVGSSSAFGSLSVENTGDVESPVSWVLRGPGGPITIELGGRGFVFEDALAAGETVTITRTSQGWSVTDGTGANRYASLGPAPKFPSIPVGVSTGTIEMVDADTGAMVAGYFYVLRKTVI